MYPAPTRPPCPSSPSRSPRLPCSSAGPILSSALCQALFGNIRRLGYKLALWNCRKGLLGNEDFVSTKLIEIKNFIDKHSPHTLGIIESDIHSSRSQVRRKRTFNKEETSLYATVFSFIFGSYVRFSETLFI